MKLQPSLTMQHLHFHFKYDIHITQVPPMRASRRWREAILKNTKLMTLVIALFFFSFYICKATDHEEPTKDELVNEGLFYANQGNHEEASKCFEEALGLDPDYASAHALIGDSLTTLGKKSEGKEHIFHALSLYEASISQDPTNIAMLLNIASCYGMLKNIDEANKRYQEALEILNCKGTEDEKEKCARIHYSIAMLYSKDPNSLSIIRSRCQEAIRIKPDYWKAHLVLGIVYLEAGENGDARLELLKAKELCDFENATIYATLATANSRRGYYEEAFAQMDKAIALADIYNFTPYKKSITYYNLGYTLYEVRRYEEAKEAYEKALELRPNYQKALYWAGINSAIVDGCSAGEEYVSKLRELNEEEASKLRRNVWLRCMPTSAKIILGCRITTEQ